ncbi:MAG: NVEALA domain-containing protein [Bacteroides sp.]|nr:NVEALA domain-containing protein [Bacteroides sp.]
MKKVIKAVFIAAIAAVAGYGVYTNQKAEPMSDLMLANVEALADFEWNENGWYCWQRSVDDYSSDVFFTYIRCFDCNVSTAITVYDESQCWH